MADPPKTHQRRPLALALGLVLLLLLPATFIGCGGSGEDITAKSPAAILAASARTALSASGVHVLSQFSSGKLHVNTELQLAGAGGGRAHSSFGNRSNEAIRIGDTIYIKVGAILAKRLASTGVHISVGSWVKASAKDPQVAQFVSATQPSGDLAFMLRAPTVSLAKGPITTIHGKKAIKLKTEGKLYTGAIYIAASGAPYPIEIVKHGRETGQVTFSGWNQPVALSPPANAVELSKLEKR